MEAEPEQQSEHMQLESNHARSTEARSIPMEEDSERTSGDIPTGNTDIEPSCEGMQLDNDIAVSTNQTEEENMRPPSDTATTNQDTTTPSSSDNVIYDNLMYDKNTQQYFIGQFNNKLKRYLKKTLVADLTTIDSQLVEDAKKQPNVWVSLPLGDPCDDPPPVNLITKIKCLYEQLDKPYCITYCMASALFYCDFQKEARYLVLRCWHPCT